jgi:AraC-like DNA-binding protein
MVIAGGLRPEEANVAGMDGRDRELTYVRSPVLRGVEFMAATFRGPAPAPVLLSQLTLMLCDEGGGDVGWGRQTQPLGAGAVLVRAPHQVSVVMHHPTPETRCRVVLIEPELLPASATQETRRLARFGSVVTRLPTVVEGVRGLWDAVTRRAEAIEQQARLASLMSAVLELTAREPPRPPILTPAVARTRDALHERFAEEVPLEELATIAGMSKCHLVHLFHKEMGLPPHAYQIQLRVARARVLVAAGVPLAEVATMTGFADQSHLTRLFKRVVGMPPGQYAALLAAQSAPLPHASLAMSSSS